MKIVKRIKEEYDNYSKYLNKVFSIFKEYYGEERVDMQFPSLELYYELRAAKTLIPDYADILVYFPKVTVTNENNYSHEITDLYLKFRIDTKGKLLYRFTMSRASYTQAELNADYMHSHAPGINSTDPSIFKDVCTGTGPINRTIASLNAAFNEDIWRLFAVELDCYTKVESLSGVPYRRLSSVSSKYNTDILSRNSYHKYGMDKGKLTLESKINMPQFILHLLEDNIIPFVWNTYSYKIALSRPEFYSTLANEYIKFNEGKEEFSIADLKYYGIIVSAKISQNSIKIMEGNSTNLRRDIEGKYVCTFKNKDIHVNIKEDKEESEGEYLILNPDITELIYNTLLTVVNYYYGNKETITSDSGQYTRII